MTDLGLSYDLQAQTLLVTGSLTYTETDDLASAVCYAIIEHGGRLTSIELADHLLSGRSLLALSVLRSLTTRQLVEPSGDSWTLTPSGVELTKSKSIAVSVLGVWRMSFVKCPFNGHQIISLEPFRDREYEPCRSYDEGLPGPTTPVGASSVFAAGSRAGFVPGSVAKALVLETQAVTAIDWSAERFVATIDNTESYMPVAQSRFREIAGKLLQDQPGWSPERARILLDPSAVEIASLGSGHASVRVSSQPESHFRLPNRLTIHNAPVGAAADTAAAWVGRSAHMLPAPAFDLAWSDFLTGFGDILADGTELSPSDVMAHSAPAAKLNLRCPTDWGSSQGSLGKSQLQKPLEGWICPRDSAALEDALVEASDAAESMIVVGSFLFAMPRLTAAIRSACDRGIGVYVITNATDRLSQAGSDLEDTYADEGLNQRDTSNFNEDRRQETLSFLKELSGLAVVRSAPGFHAKFLVADPFGKTPSGILTTSNLISFALNRNDEVAVRLNPAEVFTLAEAAHWALSVAESELQPGRITEASTWPAHIPVASQRDDLVARRGSYDPLMGQWTDAVRKAQTSIVATNFGWESTHQFVDAMVEAAGRGVRVAAVMKRRNANDAARDALRSAGATVLTRPWMHAKTLLVDDQVFVGTANFTDEDDATCFEVGLRLEGDRAEFVRAVVGSWIDTVDAPGPG